MALRKGDRSRQRTFLPNAVEDYVSEEDPVRVYDEFVEMLDFKELKIDLNEKRVGNSSYDPKSMLKLLVYGYSYGWKSSRKLERATKHNLSFMWLMGNLQPDHKTISRFRKDNQESLHKVLVQCARLCKELKMIEGNILFLDGSKVRGNASINQTKTEKGLEKELERLNEKVEKLLSDIEKIDKSEENLSVNLGKELNSVEKRKTKVKEALSKLKESEKTSINVTDNECVKIKGRQGTHAGYNTQMTVDEKNGLIVNANVVDTSNDLGHFTSEIMSANEILGEDCEVACADAGYFDIDDLKDMKDKDIMVVVPNKKQAAHKPKEQVKFDKENFKYDIENDKYICPAGKELKFKRRREDRKVKEYIIEKRSYCKNCIHFGDCTSSKSGRTLTVSFYEEDKENLAKVYESEKGKEIYKLRKSKVELPFGHIKRNLNGWLLLLRGKTGANAEMAINATCFNVTRLIRLLGGVRPLIDKFKEIKGKIAVI